jgi:NAD(P)-dependent dehydrogenase (short-subunit alcohol dehydrogenase family)
MQQFTDKVAVVTGAASGIGLAIAQRCVEEGMHVAIADIEHDPLQQARQQLAALGRGSVSAHLVDVGNAAQVEAFADEVFAMHGAVHLLVNNAGVGGGARNCWELELDYWQWVLNVNLMGVVHGIRFFIPRMLAQTEGHIINTASVAGLMSAPGSAAYNVSKHGVVALSETLQGELRQVNPRLDVSVLCPSFVNTRIYAAERNRPHRGASSEEQLAMEAAAKEFFDAIALSPDAVAEHVFDALHCRRFYILPHPGVKAQVAKRMEAILNDGAPNLRGAEDFPLD